MKKIRILFRFLGKQIKSLICKYLTHDVRIDINGDGETDITIHRKSHTKEE